MEISKKTLSASPSPGNLSGGNGAYPVQLLEKARADTDTVLKELGSQPDGLSEAEAGSRLKQVGTNDRRGCATTSSVFTARPVNRTRPGAPCPAQKRSVASMP